MKYYDEEIKLFIQDKNESYKKQLIEAAQDVIGRIDKGINLIASPFECKFCKIIIEDENRQTNVFGLKELCENCIFTYCLKCGDDCPCMTKIHLTDASIKKHMLRIQAIVSENLK